MKFHKTLLLTLLGIGLAGFLGCTRPEPVRKLTEEEQAEIDAGMKKAMLKNRNAVEKKDQKKTQPPVPIPVPKTQPPVPQPPVPQPPAPKGPQPPAPKGP